MLIDLGWAPTQRPAGVLQFRAMETNGEIDQLATLARSADDQYAPYVEDLVGQLANALRVALPDVPNEQIGAVLMVAADQLAKANAERAHTVSALAMTNALIVLGERLYSGAAR